MLRVIPLALLALAATDCGQRPSGGFRDYAKPLAGEEWSGAIEAPANVTWRTTLADEREKGEPMIVKGTVYKEDGKTPAWGILLYVYHTDHEGRYSRGTGKGTGPRHGKLRGWMLTNQQGQYEFRSIRPAGYPGRPDPQHIHITVTGPGIHEHSIDAYLFLDDPRLPASERPRTRSAFNYVVDPQKKDGVWHVRRDIRLWSAEERERRGKE